MAIPSFTMRQLIEAGVHFGHHARRWNPKMSSYLFGIRNGIHIINLEHTVPMLHKALQVAQETVASGGRVLFVGTKRQASEKIADSAKKCGQYFINHRWLGGTLTNWKTVSQSIKKLRDLEDKLADSELRLTKKEMLSLERQKNKLERALGGIREMGGLPDLLFVIDTGIEQTAILEAKKLNIPIIAICDSNSDPTVTYPIPGNDDSSRSVSLYCDLMCLSILDGLQMGLTSAGVDIGAMEEPAAEIPNETPEVIEDSGISNEIAAQEESKS